MKLFRVFLDGNVIDVKADRAEENTEDMPGGTGTFALKLYLKDQLVGRFGLGHVQGYLMMEIV